MTTRHEQGEWVAGIIKDKGNFVQNLLNRRAATRYHKEVLHQKVKPNSELATNIKDKELGKALGRLSSDEINKLEQDHAQQHPHTLNEYLPPGLSNIEDYRR